MVAWRLGREAWRSGRNNSASPAGRRSGLRQPAPARRRLRRALSPASNASGISAIPSCIFPLTFPLNHRPDQAPPRRPRCRVTFGHGFWHSGRAEPALPLRCIVAKRAGRLHARHRVPQLAEFGGKACFAPLDCRDRCATADVAARCCTIELQGDRSARSRTSSRAAAGRASSIPSVRVRPRASPRRRPCWPGPPRPTRPASRARCGGRCAGAATAPTHRPPTTRSGPDELAGAEVQDAALAATSKASPRSHRIVDALQPHRQSKIMSGGTPASRCSSAESWRWVVEARMDHQRLGIAHALARWLIICSAWIKRSPASCPPWMPKEKIEPARGGRYFPRERMVGGWTRGPGYPTRG